MTRELWDVMRERALRRSRIARELRRKHPDWTAHEIGSCPRCKGEKR